MKPSIAICLALVLQLALSSVLLAEEPENTGPLSNLVLLPVESEQISRDLREGYRSVIAEYLGAEYKVFTGSNVDDMLQTEFEKQCKISDDVDAASSECVQNVAGELNADLVALPKIIQTAEGYLVTLEISDVFTEQLITTYSEICVGCSPLDLTSTFQKMIFNKGSSATSAPLFIDPTGPTSGGSSSVVDLGTPVKPQDRGKLAVLLLESIPSGAEVWLGDIKAGTTPYQNLQLSSGQNLNITLKAQEYRDLQVALTLQPGSNTPKAFELVPAFGSLSITSEPSGADVYLSGELVGQTPYSDPRLASAKYLVDIRKPLYLPLSNQTIAIEDGQRTERSFKLQPNFGELSVASEPSAATITLEANGKEVFRGNTPIALQLEPTAYILSVSKSGYAQRRFEVKIARGQRTSISKEQLQLRRLSGTAVISSEPASPGARVLIDGKDAGKVPLITELPVGTYEVTIKGDKLQGSAKLQIRDGKQQTLVVELQSVQQSKTEPKPETSSIAKARPNIRTVSKSELIKLLGSTHSDYTKLDAQGYELPKSAKSWSCVLDNRSGLVWEVKTNDGSARDKDNGYRWGGRGVSDVALANYDGNDESRRKQSHWDGKGGRYDDWNKLVDAANSERLCGFSDWRVPDLYELASLVRCRGGRYKNLDDGCSGSYQRPTIDTNYFPNTKSGAYWSASPDARYRYNAWLLGFSNGNGSHLGNRDFSYRVRLVRSGQ